MFSFLKKENGEKKKKKEKNDSQGSSKLPGLSGTSSSPTHEKMTPQELNRLEEVHCSRTVTDYDRSV